MSRRSQENLFAAVLLCMFAGVIVLSLDFGPRARMIPLPLAIFGLVLTVVQILWQNLGSTDELRVELISVAGPTGVREGGAGAEAPASLPEQRPSWRSEAAAYGIVAGLLVLTLLAGPMPAVFLFTGGYFMVTRQYSLRASLLYTVVFTVAVHLLFFVALQIQPYHGLLEPIFARIQ